MIPELLFKEEKEESEFHENIWVNYIWFQKVFPLISQTKKFYKEVKLPQKLLFQFSLLDYEIKTYY